MDPNVTLNRVLRLIKLDTTVFDEVRDDANELIPAIVVAVVSAFLAGIGSFLWWQVNYDGSGPDGLFLNTVILGPIFLAAIFKEAFERGAKPIPAGEQMAVLAPGEHPWTGAQILDALGAEPPRRARTQLEQRQFFNRAG